MRASIKRIIASLMALTMLASFAACGDKKDDTTTTKKADDAVATDVVTNEDGETEIVVVDDEETEKGNEIPEEDDTTTKKDEDKTTTKKDEDKTTTKKDDKTTTKKDDKTTTKKDDKTTTKKEDKIPSSKSEILKVYKDAAAKVNSSKAGYTKTRSSTTSKFNVPGAFSAFKGMIEGFMGIGSKNKYTATVAKGEFGGKIKDDAKGKSQTYFFLSEIKLSESDIKKAECKKDGDNYIVTLTLNNGSSSAGNGVSTKNNSPLDRSGLCVGDRDIDIFDHKTAEIMYSAIEGTAKKTTIDEKTSNAKIVATINASSGKLSNLKITFDLECDMKVNFLGTHNIEAKGTTTVEYKSFKW